jgi:hypothetical protein
MSDGFVALSPWHVAFLQGLHVGCESTARYHELRFPLTADTEMFRYSGKLKHENSVEASNCGV